LKYGLIHIMDHAKQLEALRFHGVAQLTPVTQLGPADQLLLILQCRRNKLLTAARGR